VSKKRIVMGKSKFADFMLIYAAISSAAIGLLALFAKLYLDGVGCLALGVALLAFDRWSRKRGF
jgi:hypothetical protein